MLNLFLALRPVNLLIILLAQILASYFLGFSNSWGDVFNTDHLIIYLSTFLCAASGYLLNDCLDSKTDAINRPLKNHLSTPYLKKSAYMMVVLLVLTSILLAFLKSIWFVKVMVAINIVLIGYNFFLKRWPIIGNLIIALLAAFSILILLAFDAHLKKELIFIFSINAFAIHWIREIIKDAEDIKGDEVSGYHTLPIMIGLKNTRTFLIILVFFYILIFTTSIRIMMLHYFTAPFSYIFLSYNILCIGLPLFHLLAKLQNEQLETDYHYLNKVTLYIMVTGTAMMMFF